MKRLAVVALLGALVLTGCAAGGKPQPIAAPNVTTPQPGPTPGKQVEPPKAPEPSPQPPPPPPAPKAVIEPAQVLQGDFAQVQLDRAVDGDVKVAVAGLDEQPKVFRLGGRPVAFIGFPANAKVGNYPVTVTWPGGTWKGNVAVVYKKFTEDRLVVTAQQEATYYDPRQADEYARLYASRSKSYPLPLWDGPLQAPLDGTLEVTTYFGEIRFINGTETGRHSGMDFGAKQGTPVHAPAKGQVMMAERLIVTGGTIVIDHGMNLYTTYYHLSAFDVKPGDWVEPGQLIGKVGNTGFSLGAHLHWTATIGNTPVDPWPLTLSAPFGVRRRGPVMEQ